VDIICQLLCTCTVYIWQYIEHKQPKLEVWKLGSWNGAAQGSICEISVLYQVFTSNDSTAGSLHSVNDEPGCTSGENLQPGPQRFQSGLNHGIKSNNVAIAASPSSSATVCPGSDVSSLDVCKVLRPFKRSPPFSTMALLTLITFRVSRRRREMYIRHASLCVCVHVSLCLSFAACPH